MGTISDSAPGYLCDMDDTGRDLYCADGNPQLMANGGISATSISTSVINFAGITATSVLGAGGNFIVSGTTSVSASNAGTIKFATAGSERMVIDGTGNVGIGIPTPNAQLQLANNIGSAGDANAILLWEDIGAGREFGFGISSGDINYRSDNHVFYTDSSSPTEKLRIKANGNVGIGTINPQTTLEVVGTISTSLVELRDARVRHPSSGSIDVNWEDDYWRYRFGGTATPRGIRLDDYDNVGIELKRSGGAYFAGNVGIGTSSPSAQLELDAATASIPQLLLRNGTKDITVPDGQVLQIGH